MTKRQLLIITDSHKDRSRFFASPFGLNPEITKITGASSLNYISFSGFKSIVIDSPGLYQCLKKISLGIRDSADTEALWRILSKKSPAPVFFLVDRKSPPTREMTNLDIAYILPLELKEMGQKLSDRNEQLITTPSSGPSSNNLLTADDIRRMHREGKRTIKSEQKLTSWAKEVADSLGLSQSTHNTKLLLNLGKASPKTLEKIKSDVFELSTRFPEMLFVVNPLCITVFNKLFPSLQGRVVSTSIHWGEKGAFTGETSAAMLADLRCAGAILPASMPYCESTNLKAVLNQAAKYNIELFSTFSLAPGTGCDIIATGIANDVAFSMTPLFDRQGLTAEGLPETKAVIEDIKFFRELPSRKGHY
ncbi:MAG: triose-phosphate isomerase [Candidatus Rifleibacteriota bacterium]